MDEQEYEVLVADTEDYVSLLGEYNYNKPRTNLLARSVIKPGIDLKDVMESFTNNFNIDNAVGDQLDIIGRMLGLDRLLNYVPASGSREMSDDEYRLALKLQIAKNTWDGTLGSLRSIYRDALGSDVSLIYVDNQDMSIDINVYGDMSTRETEMLEKSGLLLVPVGVGKSVNVVGGNADTQTYIGLGSYSIEWIDGAIAD